MAEQNDWGDWGSSGGDSWGGSGSWDGGSSWNSGGSWGGSDSWSSAGGSDNWGSESPAGAGKNDSLANHSWGDTLTPSKGPTPVGQTSSRKNSTPSSPMQGLSPAKDVYVGIAQNVQSIPEKQRTFIRAWMESLIHGVPCVNGTVRNVFNLQMPDVEDSMSLTQQRSIAVTFFGEANTGLIGRGQTLQVKGRFGSDRTIYATEIENLTNGSRIEIDSGIPSAVVRVLTLLLVGIIVWLINDLVMPGTSALFGAAAGVDWTTLVIGVVAVALGIWWLFNLLTRPSRNTIYVVGVILLLLLLRFLPSLGSMILYLIILCLVIYWLIKKCFR